MKQAMAAALLTQFELHFDPSAGGRARAGEVASASVARAMIGRKTVSEREGRDRVMRVSASISGPEPFPSVSRLANAGHRRQSRDPTTNGSAEQAEPHGVSNNAGGGRLSRGCAIDRRD